MGGKLSNEQLKEKVFNLCDTLGFWNVRPVPTAKDLGTAHQNVSRWKEEYIEQHGIPDIDKMGKELNVNGQMMLKELVKITKTTKNNKEKTQAINSYFGSVEKFNSFLENFSFKEKIADKLQFQDTTEYNMADAYDELLKEEKRRSAKSKKASSKRTDKKKGR